MTEQPSLHTLRRRLVQLGRARRLRRWFCGLSVMGTALLWALAAVFLTDVLFELDVVQRITVFLLATAVLCWSTHRYVRPYFGLHETEVDLALMVEREHHIDTDLVAAIEFTRPAARSWGSSTLRNKVIGDMTERGRHIEMARVVDQREPLRKLRTLIITLTVAAVVAAIFPQHLLIFMRRLALHADHYPSRTVIESVVVNDQLVLERRDELSPRTTQCPELGRVAFLVRCTRHAPESGELLIWAIDGSGRRRIPLTQRKPRTEGPGSGETLFVAQLPNLLDSLKYQIYLGDAWTNPGTIEMVPLPQVEIHTTVSPPAYTGAPPNPRPTDGTLRMTVLEGSQVDLAVSCANGKRFAAVSIELQTAGQTTRTDLQSVHGAGLEWQMESAAFPPLQSVSETIRYTVHATDQDGLQPSSPPSGEIRVEPDLPPGAAVATIHRVVLPTAKPPVAFHVHDDYGIGRLRIRLQIERYERKSDAPLPAVVPVETNWLDVDNVEFPIRQSQLPYRNRYVLDLEPWQLHKGDRLKVALETTDFRGSAAGASAISKPLYLEVSDQAGVLAAILEADQRTERDLDEMIERQLGLGTD